MLRLPERSSALGGCLTLALVPLRARFGTDPGPDRRGTASAGRHPYRGNRHRWRLGRIGAESLSGLPAKAPPPIAFRLLSLPEPSPALFRAIGKVCLAEARLHCSTRRNPGPIPPLGSVRQPRRNREVRATGGRTCCSISRCWGFQDGANVRSPRAPLSRAAGHGGVLGPPAGRERLRSSR